jgi:hypothetical protein
MPLTGDGLHSEAREIYYSDDLEKRIIKLKHRKNWEDGTSSYA